MSDQISATEARLSTHEQVCAHRYESIQKSFDSGSKRMAKIEYLLYAVIVVVLLGPGVGAEFFKHLFRL